MITLGSPPQLSMTMPEVWMMAGTDLEKPLEDVVDGGQQPFVRWWQEALLQKRQLYTYQETASLQDLLEEVRVGSSADTSDGDGLMKSSAPSSAAISSETARSRGGICRTLWMTTG